MRKNRVAPIRASGKDAVAEEGAVCPLWACGPFIPEDIFGTKKGGPA